MNLFRKRPKYRIYRNSHNELWYVEVNYGTIFDDWYPEYPQFVKKEDAEAYVERELATYKNALNISAAEKLNIQNFYLED